MRVITTLVSILTIGAASLLAQAPAPIHLTLQDAEALSLKNHPQVLAAQDVISAANQRAREARAAYYPELNGDTTGSQGNPQGRIGAGYLTDSRLFNRYGLGVTLNQLITDSGRTPNLVANARLRANASEQDYQATRYDVLVGVNNAYFGTLRSQALVRVAQETVATRQLLVNQVTALAENNLRSQLDVSFVSVNLAQAQLLLISAQNEVQRAFAELTRALGSDQPAMYDLVEEALPPSPPGDLEMLVAQAIQNRPELASLRLSLQAANKFEQAEKDLSYPTVSFLGVGGYMPYINQELSVPIPKEYEGVGVNVQIPIFNGHLFTARREEAHYRALEVDQRLRDRQQQIVRDVRAAWTTANTAYQRLDVTAQFLRQATLANDLAKGRYDLGLSSIVELTQAQLNVTQAEIENLSAKYDYQSQYATLQYTIGGLR
ncbi:MAG TPA: TolC family protein [Bryobacteraceae bacterium]|nr:TolC family protein [Bryobacteraceae bacterium]